VIAFGLAGCGSSTSGDSGGGSVGGDSGASSGVYPVTVDTIHGRITVKKQPKRIVALSFADAGELLSLGVKPVRVATDPESLEASARWMADGIQDHAASTLTTASYELNVEAIAETKPDLIIAQIYRIKDRAIFDPRRIRLRHRLGVRPDNHRLFQQLPSVKNKSVYRAALDFADAIDSPEPPALRWLVDQLKPDIQALAG
jgi:ABC-type Fe3+-hydroxamate transport system substrate-binding protein